MSLPILWLPNLESVELMSYLYIMDSLDVHKCFIIMPFIWDYCFISSRTTFWNDFLHISSLSASGVVLITNKISIGTVFMSGPIIGHI